MRDVLVVVQDFAEFRRGQVISDPARMTEVLAGEQRVHVVKSRHPDDAPPPAESAKAD